MHLCTGWNKRSVQSLTQLVQYTECSVLIPEPWILQNCIESGLCLGSRSITSRRNRYCPSCISGSNAYGSRLPSQSRTLFALTRERRVATLSGNQVVTSPFTQVEVYVREEERKKENIIRKRQRMKGEVLLKQKYMHEYPRLIER